MADNNLTNMKHHDSKDIWNIVTYQSILLNMFGLHIAKRIIQFLFQKCKCKIFFLCFEFTKLIFLTCGFLPLFRKSESNSSDAFTTVLFFFKQRMRTKCLAWKNTGKYLRTSKLTCALRKPCVHTEWFHR